MNRVLPSSSGMQPDVMAVAYMGFCLLGQQLIGK